MTALNPEAKQPDIQAQVKSDGNSSQQNNDVNLSQKTAETPEQNKQEPKTEETAEDPNWRAFRESRKKDRARIAEVEAIAAKKQAEVEAYKAAMEASFAKSPPAATAYQQYYGMNQNYEKPEETEEQRIARLVEEQIAKKEEQYRRQQQEEEQREFPNRLMRDFPDFKQVCSQENLDYLDFHYPEIARPLGRLGDGYDKWHDTYHAVKKLIPNHSTAKKESVRADLNANKPKSISSTAPSPTGERVAESWQDTERRRAENWARMQRTMKGV